METEIRLVERYVYEIDVYEIDVQEIDVSPGVRIVVKQLT